MQTKLNIVHIVNPPLLYSMVNFDKEFKVVTTLFKPVSILFKSDAVIVVPEEAVSDQVFLVYEIAIELSFNIFIIIHGFMIARTKKNNSKPYRFV